MANTIIEAMSEALIGVHVDDSMSTVDILDALRGPSAAANARSIGVPPSTFRGWLKGITPKIGKRALVAAVRRANLPPGLESDIRSGTRRMRITGWIIKSKDRRERTIRIGDHIPKPLISRTLTAWLAGRDQTADKLINNAITKYYMAGAGIDPPLSMGFEE